MFQKLNKNFVCYKIIWFELEFFLPSMNVELRLKMPWLTHNATTIQNVKFVQKFIFSFELFRISTEFQDQVEKCKIFVYKNK